MCCNCKLQGAWIHRKLLMQLDKFSQTFYVTAWYMYVDFLLVIYWTQKETHYFYNATFSLIAMEFYNKSFLIVFCIRHDNIKLRQRKIDMIR